MTARKSIGRSKSFSHYEASKKILYTWDAIHGGTYSGFISFCNRHASTLDNATESTKHLFITVKKSKNGFEIETP